MNAKHATTCMKHVRLSLMTSTMTARLLGLGLRLIPIAASSCIAHVYVTPMLVWRSSLLDLFTIAESAWNYIT